MKIDVFEEEMKIINCLHKNNIDCAIEAVFNTGIISIVDKGIFRRYKPAFIIGNLREIGYRFLMYENTFLKSTYVFEKIVKRM